jgi:hypothetical protein
MTDPRQQSGEALHSQPELFYQTFHVEMGETEGRIFFLVRGGSVPSVAFPITPTVG